MKIVFAFALIFTLVSMSWVYALDSEMKIITKEMRDRRSFVENVLEKSVFSTETAPESLAEGEITTYDPMLVTVVASVKSRLPARDTSRWIQVKLPPSDAVRNRICPHPFKVFARHSNTNNPYTFVILPGAYSEWETGSFHNQTVAAVDKYFNDPTVISFSGYLSSDFLEGACVQVPWDKRIIAKDLYSRLGIYLNKIQAKSEHTGIIGFSGGGGLSIHILGVDAQSSRLHNGQRFFGLGGAVFSPIPLYMEELYLKT